MNWTYFVQRAAPISIRRYPTIIKGIVPPGQKWVPAAKAWDSTGCAPVSCCHRTDDEQMSEEEFEAAGGSGAILAGAAQVA